MDSLYIDFHTHIIPDVYLKKKLQKGQANFPTRGKPLSDYFEVKYQGSVDDLLISMNRSGIQYSVVLPVAKVPGKVEIINRMVKSIVTKYPQLIPFGTIHPAYQDKEKEIDLLHQWGFMGVKLHLFHQSQHHPSRPSFLSKDILTLFRILEKFAFILVVDTYFPWDIGAEPLTLGELMGLKDLFPKLRIVAAHMGSVVDWEAMLPYYGRNIFLDISYTLGIVPNEVLESIIKIHGADKILFGSDFPFRTPEREVERFMTLKVSYEEKIKILGKNAMCLLGLSHEKIDRKPMMRESNFTK